MATRMILGSVAALLLISSAAAAKVQCSCPKISAVGEGNTSCSAAESGGQCTIDFNVFGVESERLAASLISNYGGGQPEPFDPTLPAFEALRRLGAEPAGRILDAVSIYTLVATASQSSRSPRSIRSDDVKSVVTLARYSSLAQQIGQAFGGDAQRRWAGGSDEDVRRAGFSTEAMEGGRVVLAPGCVEITSGDLWVMFKAAWSPARVVPRCKRE